MSKNKEYQLIQCQDWTEDKLMDVIKEKCRFKYYSYDHKKAIQEYRTSDKYKMVRSLLTNPNCHLMPDELKEKYKTEKIGSVREIHFARNGNPWRFKIGHKYAKSFYIEDFGKIVFPVKEVVKQTKTQ